MIYPVLRVRLSVQSRRLHKHLLIRRIEVHSSNGGRLSCLWVLDADAGKVRRNNEVHALPSVRKYPKHAEEDESAHGSAVVVAWYLEVRYGSQQLSWASES